MASTSSKGIAVSSSNTPQARDDVFDLNQTAALAGVRTLDVMANDAGGNAKSLYSLDDGSNSTGPTGDLLQQDAIGAINYSQLGAKIWITADGKVAYDATALGDLHHLAAGRHLIDTFTYAIRLGNGTISEATATVDIVGVNDPPVVIGPVIGNATEDGPAVMLNALANASDLDDGTVLSVVGMPGVLPAGVTYNIATHSFTLDPSNAAYQHLEAGAQQTVSVSYGVSDGMITTPGSVSWTVTGVNDPAGISGDTSGHLTEDDTAAAIGTLTVSDIDDGEAHIKVASGNGAHNLGSYSVDSGGHWSYTVNNAAVQHLNAHESATDTFMVASFDGTASQQVTITIAGVNDPASISGEISGHLTEDDTTPVMGTLSVSDVDDGEAHTKPASGNGANSLGSYSIDGSGQWSYTVNNVAMQHLNSHESATDTFVVASLDGTASQQVMITIQGLNDPASISGEISGHLTEDDTTPVMGTLSVSDVDDGEAHTKPASGNGANSLGSFTVDGDGHWSYTLNNAAVQHLNSHESATDTFGVSSLDGTAAQQVTITIQGVNDPASIGGDAFGQVFEVSSPSDTGTLAVSDVDDGEAHTQTATNLTSLGGFGTYSVDADGNWSYSLTGFGPPIGAGQHTSDSFIVKSLDGTASQTVTIDIVGTNHAPSIVQADDAGTVTEDEPQGTSNQPSPLDTILTDDGTISFHDVDLSDEHHTVQVTPDGTGYLGTLAASVTQQISHLGTSADLTGIVSWQFSVTNADLQFLSQDQAITQNYTIIIDDGHGGTVPQDVAIHLFGANDPPTVSVNPSTGSLDETLGTPAPGAQLSADGSVIFSDVDTLDTHTVGTPVFINTGTSTATQVGHLDATLNTDGFSVSWTYTVDAVAVEYLQDGEQLVESFAVPIFDNHGGTVQEIVQVTVDGSDDAAANNDPVIDTSSLDNLSYLGSPMLVSANSSGTPANNGFNAHGRVAPDGHHVLFWSSATNLGAVASGQQLYLKDMTTGAVTLVSGNATNTANNSVLFPDNTSDQLFSPDGTKVIFSSLASNLVSGDTNGTYDTFIKDLGTGAVTLVSTGANGHGNGPSYGGVFSPDGSKVAFFSSTSSLVVGGTAGIYEKDLATGVIKEVAVGGDINSIPIFSPDGTHLVYDDGNQSYIVDLSNDVRTVVSANASNQSGNGTSMLPVFSPDGTEVAFGSTATNLVAGVTSGFIQTYIKDLATGAVTLVSKDVNGVPANATPNWPPYFSPDGTKVAFESGASNLVPGHSFGAYVKDLATGHVTYVDIGADPAFSRDGASLVYTGGGNSQVDLDPILHAAGAVIDNTTLATLMTSDSFNFSDLDLSDIHSVSVTPHAGAHGTLNASISHDTTNTGTGGVVFWDYQVPEPTVHALTGPVPDTFTVTVDDGHGGHAAIDLTIALLQRDLLL